MIKKGRSGQFRFSLVGRNRQIVGHQRDLHHQGVVHEGIKAVKTLGADAAIEDQTTKAWAAEQEKVKAATKRATKTAAGAAKKAIKQAAGVARPRGSAS